MLNAALGNFFLFYVMEIFIGLCKGTTLGRGRTTKPQQKPAFLPLPSVFPLHTLSQHHLPYCRLLLFIIARRFVGLGLVYALYYSLRLIISINPLSAGSHSTESSVSAVSHFASSASFRTRSPCFTTA